MFVHFVAKTDVTGSTTVVSPLIYLNREDLRNSGANSDQADNDQLDPYPGVLNIVFQRVFSGRPVGVTPIRGQAMGFFCRCSRRAVWVCC